MYAAVPGISPVRVAANVSFGDCDAAGSSSSPSGAISLAEFIFPRQLLPDDIVVVATGLPGRAQALYPEERDSIARAAPRRIREFAAGRECARLALERLGVRDVAVPSGEDRAPIWPQGVVGSISHCQGCCVAAVAWRSKVGSLGIDVEQADPLAYGLLPEILSTAERLHLSGLGRRSLLVWSKVAFSAKESIFKCYHSVTKQFLGFRDIQLQILPEQRRFVGRLADPGLPPALGVRRFDGRFTVTRRFVYTAVALPGAEVPEEGTAIQDPESY